MAAEPILKHVALSIRQLSTETGLARDTIRKYLDESQVEPCAKRGGHPVYRLRDVLPVIYYGGEAGTDPDKLKPFERNAWYKGEREKLHLQTERGDVVPSLEVERRFGNRNKLIVQYLETSPDVLERDVGMTPEQLARFERYLDELRESLYALMVDEDDDDADRADQDSA